MTNSITQIRKRNGLITSFRPEKIEAAIKKALIATQTYGEKLASELSRHVISIIEQRTGNEIPTVEQVQDIVEEVLMQHGYPNVAKAYILYREQRSDIRRFKENIGVRDDLKLGINAIKVLERRYLQKDYGGNVIETPTALFRRVARTIAAVETRFNPDANVKDLEQSFFELMSNLEFLPNSPTLMNAGNSFGQLSACFVLPVEDSIVDIFEALKNMAIIHQSGGGTGFSFSRLPNRAAARCCISLAALFVKVTARIRLGGTPLLISSTSRCMTTRVFPVPAPASTRSGPERVWTA